MAEAQAPTSRFWQSSRFQAWLDRRVPPSGTVKLGQKNIFILPTREGFYFVILILGMMMAAINYQNSLIFALAFLLASVFMVSILHTYQNLSGLKLKAGSCKPAFAGEDAEFQVILSREGHRTHEALVLGWQEELRVGADLVEEDSVRVRLFVTTSQRGRLRPGRLLVQTHYPVGLFRAWSWVDLDVSTLVYPRPLPAGEIPPAAASSNEGELLQKQGVDDFHGLREFQQGDALRHIAWKSYARTGDMLIKEFAAFVDRRVWLDWDHFQGMDREARLSRLCGWVIRLAATTDDYGLRLPGLEFEPANGPEHRERVLAALALFEVGES